MLAFRFMTCRGITNNAPRSCTCFILDTKHLSISEIRHRDLLNFYKLQISLLNSFYYNSSFLYIPFICKSF